MVGNCSRPFQRRVVWAISATGVSVAVAQVWGDYRSPIFCRLTEGRTELADQLRVQVRVRGTGPWSRHVWLNREVH